MDAKKAAAQKKEMAKNAPAPARKGPPPQMGDTLNQMQQGSFFRKRREIKREGGGEPGGPGAGRGMPMGGGRGAPAGGRGMGMGLGGPPGGPEGGRGRGGALPTGPLGSGPPTNPAGRGAPSSILAQLTNSGGMPSGGRGGGPAPPPSSSASGSPAGGEGGAPLDAGRGRPGSGGGDGRTMMVQWKKMRAEAGRDSAEAPPQPTPEKKD